MNNSYKLCNKQVDFSSKTSRFHQENHSRYLEAARFERDMLRHIGTFGPNSCAIASAMAVFPVPGGPANLPGNSREIHTCVQYGFEPAPDIEFAPFSNTSVFGEFQTISIELCQHGCILTFPSAPSFSFREETLSLSLSLW